MNTCLHQECQPLSLELSFPISTICWIFSVRWHEVTSNSRCYFLSTWTSALTLILWKWYQETAICNAQNSKMTFGIESTATWFLPCIIFLFGSYTFILLSIYQFWEPHSILSSGFQYFTSLSKSKEQIKVITSGSLNFTRSPILNVLVLSSCTFSAII